MTHLLNLCILLFTGALFGIALSASVIIHPILVSSKPEAALAIFKPFYGKTHMWILILSITITIMALAYSILTANWWWFIVSLFMHINGPYTLVFMMPLNKRLLNENTDPYSEETKNDLKEWGGLHFIRTCLNAIVFLGFIYLSI